MMRRITAPRRRGGPRVLGRAAASPTVFRVAAHLCAAAALLGGLLCACAHAPAPDERPVVVVLFDLSASTDASVIRARYLEDFGKVATYTASKEGLLFADLIDEDPLAHSELPIQTSFLLPERVRGNPLYESAARNKMVSAVTAQVSELLGREPSQGTDILGAVQLAQRIFEREGASGPHYLVIFSDMFNKSPDADFYSNVPAPRDVQTLIAALTRSGRLPDLCGVSVLVSGAGVQAQASASPERILSVQHFWQAYFGATGAELQPGWYSGRLISFPGGD